MRISYSIAKQWWDGNKDQAIAMINGDEIDYPRNLERAFGYGTGVHFCWELESKKTGRLPIIQENQDVKILATELKMYRKLTEKDWLVGKIDWVGWHEIHKMLILGDHKTGSTHDQWQAPVYHLLAKDALPEYLDLFIETKDLTAFDLNNPEQFWYTTLDKLTGRASVDIVKLTTPRNKAEWELPEATTYTKGYNWIMTILEEIKQELGI